MIKISNNNKNNYDNNDKLLKSKQHLKKMSILSSSS